MTFQLDTSGAALLPHPTPEDPAGKAQTAAIGANPLITKIGRS